MTGCSAPNCTNRTGNGKAFYAVPCGRTDVRRRLKWLLRMGRDRPAPKGTRICEDHFTQDQFEGPCLRGRRRLKADAVPSIFSPITTKDCLNACAPSAAQEYLETSLDVASERHDTLTGSPGVTVPVQQSFSSAAIMTNENLNACAPSTAQEYLETSPDVAPERHDALAGSPGVTIPVQQSFSSAGKAKSYKSEREQDLERRLNLEQKRRRKAEKERDELRKSLGRVLSEDQIRALERKTMKGSAWSPGTLQKALHIKVACGSKGYNFIKENVVPLPAARTLQKHMEHIKFRPGILDEVFIALKEKVALMNPSERHACVLMDEMQISPGLDYDASIGSIIGQPTIGVSNSALKEELASHALVFMLAGCRADGPLSAARTLEAGRGGHTRIAHARDERQRRKATGGVKVAGR